MAGIEKSARDFAIDRIKEICNRVKVINNDLANRWLNANDRKMYNQEVKTALSEIIQLSERL